MFKILVLVALVLPGAYGRYRGIKTPKALQKCYDDIAKSDEGLVDELAVDTCLDNYYWKTAKERWHALHDNKTTEYFTYLWRKNVGHTRSKRQTFPVPRRRRCPRLEIRQLTKEQWRQTYMCINFLKEDTRLVPNVYEAIALIHNGESARGAHGGQAFLGWHSIYTLLFEFALRECNPDVCLPYWDTRLDAELRDPRESIFFELIGGTNGPLKSPFNGWTYRTGRDANETTVVRNIRGPGNKGLLLDYDTYERLRSANSTHAMSAIASFNRSTVIEIPYRSVLNYLGGTVQNQFVATQDIIYFFLHGFIAYIFDTNLRSLPARERRIYPRGGAGYPFGHRPNEIMAVLGTTTIRGAPRRIRNRDAYLEQWRRYFLYHPSPSCINDCYTPGNYLLCCNNRCVSKTRIISRNACQSDRRKRQTSDDNDDDKRAIGRHSLYGNDQHPVINDYVLNGVPDIKLWVFVAVKVIYFQAHEETYGSFPMKGNDRYDNNSGIYNLSRYKPLNKTNNAKQRKRSQKKCGPSESGRGFVFVRTNGINYSGHYEDNAVVDNRLPAYSAIVYVAIKKPDHENSNVIFTASDECRRVCKPYCPTKRSRSRAYKPCNGILSFDKKKPRIHGNTIGDTVAMYWKLNSDDLPESKKLKYCMIFLCDGKTWF